MLLGIGFLTVLHPVLAGRFLLSVWNMLPGLNAYYRIERYYYRHHRLSGLLTVAGGLALLYVSAIMAMNLAQPGSQNIEAIIRDAGTILFLLCGLLISIFGLTVFIRPSALKPIESWANQPVTRERAYEFFVKIKKFIRQFIISFPRVAGLFAALTGLVLICLTGN